MVLGGSAGALVGLLFVALSIHAKRISDSADLRSRAAQTLVIFAALLLTALLMAVPGQPDWVLGAELLALSGLITAFLLFLDHLAGSTDSREKVAHCSTGGQSVGIDRRAHFVLVPTACGAMFLGLASAWLLLTKLTD